jgi:hypothetical protein
VRPGTDAEVQDCSPVIGDGHEHINGLKEDGADDQEINGYDMWCIILDSTISCPLNPSIAEAG